MPFRSSIEVEVPPVGLVRLLEITPLLMNHPREDPDAWIYLALLVQPLGPGQHLILMSNRVVSLDDGGPCLRISLVRENL